MGIYPPGTGPYYAFEEPIEEQSAALPLAIQPIPIHTVDPDLDYLLRSYDNCKRYEEYLLTDVYTSPEALAKQEEEADLLSLLSDTFDFPVTLSNFYCSSSFLLLFLIIIIYYFYFYLFKSSF